MKYPVPVDGYDRTPGKGIGHLFVLDRQGNLKKDIRLGEGTAYHPGGLDFDGKDLWVPVRGVPAELAGDRLHGRPEDVPGH